MKKKYSKPEIMFESFTLSTNIAGGCVQSTHEDQGCGRLFSNGEVVFMIDSTGCATKVVPDQDGDGMWGTYCYHNPTGQNLFNS